MLKLVLSLLNYLIDGLLVAYRTQSGYFPNQSFFLYHYWSEIFGYDLIVIQSHW